QTVPGPHEHVLEQDGGQPGVGRQPQAEGVDPRRVGVVEPREGRLVALSGADHVEVDGDLLGRGHRQAERFVNGHSTWMPPTCETLSAREPDRRYSIPTEASETRAGESDG